MRAGTGGMRRPARAVVWAFVLSAVVGVAIAAAAQGGVADDRAALAALYHAAGGPEWTDGAGWLSDEPLDAWHGVATGADGRVTEIALPENNLAGALPAALGNLTRLRRLDLGGNRLGGSIPAELGGLAALEELTLWHDDDPLDPDDDGLTGTIPAALGNLANLTRLDLWDHDLTGPIPAALGRLTRLRDLVLSRNRLTGDIPAGLGNLTDLRRLRLDRNRLTGPIPASLWRLTGLQTLYLGGNDLTPGPIPAWISNLTGLQALSLSRANVTGPLPVWLGHLTNLRRLYLSYNWNLVGPLPPSLDLSHLEGLDVFGTRACAPAAWQTWLAGLDYHGAVCGSPSDVIDVAVFHTAAARDAAGGPDGIAAAIDLYVAETNRALEESGARARVALVAREEVDYAETGEYKTDIDRLRNPSDSYLDAVHTVRDRAGADLVHLIVAELNVCGVAALGGSVGITRHGCGGRTFAHELGHNLGLHHDRYELSVRQERALSLHPGYGYVNQRAFGPGAVDDDDRWLTIMAYWTQCRAHDVRCTSLLRFSNPRQTWLNDALGVRADVDSMGGDGPADAAAVLDATAPAVANFRRNRANRPPMAIGRLPYRTLHLDAGAESVDIAGAFRDPDGDPLTYAATSSAPAARVQTAGTQVVLVPTAAGAATITVTATDADGSNGSATRRFVVTVTPSAGAFTDHPLRPGATPIRAVHLLELRARIDGARERLGRLAFPWTDPVLVPGATPVRRIHLMELRRALDQAYRAAGRPPPGYTDPGLPAGAIAVRAAHLMELRAAVAALE